ncbi:MAG: hypothetical protein HY619_04135 [Thaumarchaeota archaeon]|nr:hypothetical protein [Nitrososphaerota archaeon]
MVHILDDWEALREYASYCRYGCYQLKDLGEEEEIRVMVGRFGYISTFKKNDPKLKEILDFCVRQGFLQIVKETREDIFFA